MDVDLDRAKRLYQKMLRIAPDLIGIGEYAKSRVTGHMDLICDILESGHDYRRIALSHFWEHPFGGLIPDPDMEISVFFDWELAEGTTYQDMFTYENAYPVDDQPPDFAIHNRINEILDQWLDCLAEQGHILASSG